MSRFSLFSIVGAVLLNVLALVWNESVSAKTYYVVPPESVAPTADSAKEDGSSAKPFTSLEKVRDAVRAFRLERPNESVTVELADGRYVLEKPLVFESVDSGSSDAAVVWRGAKGSRAVISGGITLSDWRDEGNGLFSAPCALTDPELGTQLFIERRVNVDSGTFLDIPYSPDAPDVRRAIRARAPNWDPDDATASYFWARKAICENRVCMKYRLQKNDLEPFVFDAEGNLLPDVQFVSYQWWSSSFNRIEKYSPETGIVEFKRSAGGYYPARHLRWHVENSRAALDAPGEWFFDRKAGRVFYIPRDDEDLGRDSVVLSVCPRWLFEIRGDWENEKCVEYVTFQNLTFSYSDADLSPEYQNSVQGAHTQRGTINAVGLARSKIVDCEFSHLGENGITLLEGCAENVIERNHVFDVGGGGIYCPAVPKGGNPSPLAITRKNRIENNLVHHVGQLFLSACGIFFGGMAQFNQVLNNDVSNSTWSGMQFGWSWCSAPAWSNHNEIGWNHIHHISRGVMNDLAGIYTLGDTDGSRLHHNWIHDVYRFTRDSEGYGGWGLYTDAGTSRLTMDHNLVHDTQDSGLHIHNYAYPYGTIARNNIFAFADVPGFVRNADMSTDKEFGVSIEKNVNFNAINEMFLGGGLREDDSSLRMSQNCYWSTVGEAQFLGKSLSEWQKASGIDAGSIVADPCFADADKRDFRLLPGSPLFALGFEPVDVKPLPGEIPKKPALRAGLYGKKKWVALASRVKHRPCQYFVPTIQNEPYRADFEDVESNELPSGFSYYQSLSQLPETSPVRVVSEQAASGKSALKITDSDAHAHSYDPHVILQRDFPVGLVKLQYSLRLGTGSALQCETRQYSCARKYYESGPQLNIQPDGSLTVAGKRLMTLPHDEWFTIAYRFPNEMSRDAQKAIEKFKSQKGKSLELPQLPADCPREWTLDVTTADGQTKSFGPFPLSEHFRTLEWVGILSFGKSQSVYFLDNVSVSLEK